MNNFYDKNDEKAISQAQKAISNDLQALKEDDACLATDEHNEHKIEDSITDTKDKCDAAIKKMHDYFEKKIEHLEHDKVHTHWYKPWTYAHNAAIDVAIAGCYAAEKASQASIEAGKYAALGAEYTALGTVKGVIALDKLDIKDDKKDLSKDRGKLVNAENALNSVESNLTSQLESSGKKQEDEASVALTNSSAKRASLKQVAQNLANIIDALSANGNEPSMKHSA